MLVCRPPRPAFGTRIILHNLPRFLGHILRTHWPHRGLWSLFSSRWFEFLFVIFFFGLLRHIDEKLSLFFFRQNKINCPQLWAHAGMAQLLGFGPRMRFSRILLFLEMNILILCLQPFIYKKKKNEVSHELSPWRRWANFNEHILKCCSGSHTSKCQRSSKPSGRVGSLRAWLMP